MEKNYVNYKYPNIGRARDIRGPYGAITDPTSGNLVVAMGFEGLLLRDQTGAWKWIAVNGYQKIQPTRMDMLKLIPQEVWESGFFFFLFSLSISLGKLGFKNYKVFIALIIGLAFCFLLVLIKAHLYLILVILNTADLDLVNNPIYELVPALIILLGMSVLTFLAVKRTWQEHRARVLKLIAFSSCIMFSYWLVFILWSQGLIFTNYRDASTIGSLLIAIVIFIFPLAKENPTKATEGSSNPR
jgi:hypothetical protein